MSAIIGNLLGIPGTLTDEATGPTGGNQTLAATRARYRVNTIPEQISDWLTKILVGVGLTQPADLPEGLRGVRDPGSKQGLIDTTTGRNFDRPKPQRIAAQDSGSRHLGSNPSSAANQKSRIEVRYGSSDSRVLSHGGAVD
jgi:hypothetical protein